MIVSEYHSPFGVLRCIAQFHSMLVEMRAVAGATVTELAHDVSGNHVKILRDVQACRGNAMPRDNVPLYITKLDLGLLQNKLAGH